MALMITISSVSIFVNVIQNSEQKLHKHIEGMLLAVQVENQLQVQEAQKPSID